ncbi:hypothetical protein NOM01_14405 [Sporolactobacillus sp. STSJ-5]|uniref:hypothetical protein n=1 Tax=Sporolactobacillus sp. STSJ-5 TaxID=2965076 RepID=UPI002102A269|nr:hypothetical protein [Sporolactobacillus sp. STSJ-5]MCQ2011177.1 hypothetical protein [Sporolactobacillus sp. STSJ-5]
MSIRIGNKNKIKNSTIGNQFNVVTEKSNEPVENKKFAEKHPIVISFFISIITGVILLFSFWKTIVTTIESLFK